MRPLTELCGLLDLEFPCSRNGLYLLGHFEFQDAVTERSGDAVNVDAGYIEASAETAVVTLAFYIVFLLILVFVFALSCDGKAVVLDVEADVLLAESGKFGFKDIGIAVIDDIGAESIYAVAGISEESALEFLKITERIKSGNS